MERPGHLAGVLSPPRRPPSFKRFYKLPTISPMNVADARGEELNGHWKWELAKLEEGYSTKLS